MNNKAKTNLTVKINAEETEPEMFTIKTKMWM